MIYQWVHGFTDDELDYDMNNNTYDYDIDYKNNPNLLDQAIKECINDGFECDALTKIKKGIDIYESIVEFITEHKRKAVRLNIEWHWYYL